MQQNRRTLERGFALVHDKGGMAQAVVEEMLVASSASPRLLPSNCFPQSPERRYEDPRRPQNPQRRRLPHLENRLMEDRV